MAATFGKLLIFELHGRRAGCFEFDDGSFDVHRLAEAGVGIDDQRQRRPACDPRRLVDQLAEGEQADVGQSQRPGRKRGSREVSGLEARSFDEPRRQRVESGSQANGRAKSGTG